MIFVPMEYLANKYEDYIEKGTTPQGPSAVVDPRGFGAHHGGGGACRSGPGKNQPGRGARGAR